MPTVPYTAAKVREYRQASRPASKQTSKREPSDFLGPVDLPRSEEQILITEPARPAPKRLPNANGVSHGRQGEEKSTTTKGGEGKQQTPPKGKGNQAAPPNRKKWGTQEGRQTKQHHPNEAKDGSTTQKEREKAAPPKGGGDQAAPPNRKEGKNNTTQRRNRPSSTTAFPSYFEGYCFLLPLGGAPFPSLPSGWGCLASSSFWSCCLPPLLGAGSQKKKQHQPEAQGKAAPPTGNEGRQHKAKRREKTQHHPKEEETKQHHPTKEMRRAAPPKGGEGRQYHTKRDGKNNTTQRMKKKSSTTVLEPGSRDTGG